jgi:hypothetical protein
MINRSRIRHGRDRRAIDGSWSCTTNWSILREPAQLDCRDLPLETITFKSGSALKRIEAFCCYESSVKNIWIPNKVEFIRESALAVNELELVEVCETNAQFTIFERTLVDARNATAVRCFGEGGRVVVGEDVWIIDHVCLRWSSDCWPMNRTRNWHCWKGDALNCSRCKGYYSICHFLSGDRLLSYTIVFTSKTSKSLKSLKIGAIALQVSLFLSADLCPSDRIHVRGRQDIITCRSCHHRQGPKNVDPPSFKTYQSVVRMGLCDQQQGMRCSPWGGTPDVLPEIDLHSGADWFH